MHFFTLIRFSQRNHRLAGAISVGGKEILGQLPYPQLIPAGLTAATGNLLSHFGALLIEARGPDAAEGSAFAGQAVRLSRVTNRDSDVCWPM